MIIFLDTNIYISILFKTDNFNYQARSIHDYLVQNRQYSIFFPKKLENECYKVMKEKSNFLYNNARNLYSKLPSEVTLQDYLVIQRFFNSEIGFQTQRKQLYDPLRLYQLRYLETKVVSWVNKQLQTREKFRSIEMKDFLRTIKETNVRLQVKLKKRIFSSLNLIKNNDPPDPAVEQEIRSLHLGNKNDEELICLFLTYLRKKSMKGVFITNDFSHFLNKKDLIEKKFPEIFITTPPYLKVALRIHQ